MRATLLYDIFTVAGKELREIIVMTGGRTKLGLIFSVLVFGVLLPLQAGRPWVESHFATFYWAWVPLYMTNGVVADSFAGERERRTLETLLATRLSDQAILFGKIAAGVAFGWGLTLANMLTGLVTVNVVYGRGELVMYSPSQFAVIGTISLVMSLLAAGIGILVSLRAATVRQATQVVGIGATLIFFLPLVALQLLSGNPRFASRIETLFAQLETLNWIQLGFIALAVVSLLIGLLFAAALARFKRARLILD